MKTTVVVLRSDDGDKCKRATEDTLAKLCVLGGLDVLVAPNLYHLPDECNTWKTISDFTSQIAVVSWLYPRPIEILLKCRQMQCDSLSVFHLGAYDTPEQCLVAITSVLGLTNTQSAVSGTITEIHEPVSERWYPIIDHSRCIGCGHCLQFCLFDVYANDETNGIAVVRPDNCKPGCPACSRVCPESAIIFPCYKKDAAIAGAPGQFVTCDPNVKPKPELNKDALDDIDLLINDLENLDRRSS